MNRAREFVERFGAVYEHSPWVAEEAAATAEDLQDPEHIAAIMAAVVDDAPVERQLALIRAHPELAGKARLAGDLTKDSSAEQSSAGLDQCTAEEYARFQELNARYHEKFGFPFVMAVRSRTRAEILAEFERRLKNDEAGEFETALGEIHKIAHLRLQILLERS